MPLFKLEKCDFTSSIDKNTYTVEPGNSKLVNSKQRVNSKLFLAAFQSVYNINHLLNSKLLAIVNLLLFLKKFTITRFDCISKKHVSYGY